MALNKATFKTRAWTALVFCLVMLAGLLLLLLSGMIVTRQVEQQSPDYYYSGFLIQRYTWLTASHFLTAGAVFNFYFRLNPWLTGLFMVLWFPLATIFELIAFPESHNLLGIEIFFHIVFMLPAVIGGYIGRMIRSRNSNPSSN